jgi:glutathione peroxidase
MADTIYDFTVKTIDGATKSLADYKGRPVMIVNVASACGLTPQYEGLEKLHETYAAKGFAVLGFPANEFGAQEPGSDADIKTFCTSKYGVKFDMFSKVVVKGEGIHPLFDFLTKANGGAIKWNFNKFLVGKDGKVVERFEPPVEPTSPEVIKAVESACAP